MTPQQQAAYSNLESCHDSASLEAGLKALEATLGPEDANLDDQKLLMAIIGLTRFVAEVASDGYSGRYKEARELLGWQ